MCTFETVPDNPLRNYLFLGEGTTATGSTQRGLGVIVASLLKHQINVATVQKGSDVGKNIVVRVESFVPEEVEGLPLLKTKRTALGIDDSLWLVTLMGHISIWQIFCNLVFFMCDSIVLEIEG